MQSDLELTRILHCIQDPAEIREKLHHLLWSLEKKRGLNDDQNLAELADGKAALIARGLEMLTMREHWVPILNEVTLAFDQRSAAAAERAI